MRLICTVSVYECDTTGLKLLTAIICAVSGALDMEVECCTVGWRDLAPSRLPD